jgi:transposase
MKKRAYRAINVNKVDEAKVSAAVKGQRVVLGVDVAKEEVFGRLMTEKREVVTTIKWQQVEQTRALVAFLGRLEASVIEVALEPSGTYGDPLVYQLQQADIGVYQVDPKRCHDAAEVYDGVPSIHDAKSADIIARMHLDGLSKPWRDKTEAERELGAAVRVMEVYDRQYHQLLSRLEAQLARHWPEVTAILELSSATLLAVLQRFGGPKALTLPWVPSRDVRASLVVGDTLYIGGLFDRIQRHVGPLALFDAEGALISSPRGVSLPRLS